MGSLWLSLQVGNEIKSRISVAEVLLNAAWIAVDADLNSAAVITNASPPFILAPSAADGCFIALVCHYVASSSQVLDPMLYVDSGQNPPKESVVLQCGVVCLAVVAGSLFLRPPSS